MQILLNTKLDDRTRKLIARHNVEIEKHRTKIESLSNEYLAAALSAHKLSVVEIDETITDLEARLQNLAADGVRLAWARFSILPSVEAAMAGALAFERGAYERVVEGVIHRMADCGVTELSMPSGSICTTTAQHQLRHRAMQEEECLQAIARVRLAESELAAVTGWRQSAPTTTSCAIFWPALPSDVHPAVRLIFEAPRARPVEHADSVAGHLKIDLGFSSRPCLPQHNALFSSLIKLCDSGPHPLKRLKPSSVAAARKLIEQLPATAEVKAWLSTHHHAKSAIA